MLATQIQPVHDTPLQRLFAGEISSVSIRGNGDYADAHLLTEMCATVNRIASGHHCEAIDGEICPICYDFAHVSMGLDRLAQALRESAVVA